MSQMNNTITATVHAPGIEQMLPDTILETGGADTGEIIEKNSAASAPQQSPQLPARQPSILPPKDNTLEDSDDLSVLDYVKDFIKGVANGPVNAVNETINLAGTLANGGEEYDWAQYGKDNGWDFDNFGKTQTALGGIAENVSTFLSSFITFGKALKAANLLQGTGKAALVARGMAQGALTDFTAFDGHSENLLSLPIFQDTMAEGFGKKEGITELQGRFQNTLVGLGVGAATEIGMALGAKAWARLHGKTGAETEKIMLNAYNQIEESMEAQGRTVDDLIPGSPERQGAEESVEKGSAIASVEQEAQTPSAPKEVCRRQHHVRIEGDGQWHPRKGSPINSVLKRNTGSAWFRRG